MSDIQIEKEIIMRPINTVRPYVRNPRRNDKTVELLCKIIPKVGFNVPLVIDEKGIIVKGHARFTAAIRLGMQEVPCIVTHADEEAIKADRIADNKISEFSEWINADLMAEIDSIDFDMSDLGLGKIVLDDLPSVEDLSSSIGESLGGTPKNGSGSVTEAQRQQLYKEFEEQQKQGVDADDFGTTPYYKCVCDKCGYTMFIKEGEL